jgi:hypothetical protein
MGAGARAAVRFPGRPEEFDRTIWQRDRPTGLTQHRLLSSKTEWERPRLMFWAGGNLFRLVSGGVVKASNHLLVPAEGTRVLKPSAAIEDVGSLRAVQFVYAGPVGHLRYLSSAIPRSNPTGPYLSQGQKKAQQVSATIIALKGTS